MNNIDILEELEEVHIVDGFVISNCLYHEIADTIETLIAENKELKEEKLKKSGIYEFNVNIEDDYIPKSKVEEVIREYKKKGNSVGIPHLYGAEIELLQSLLGKE